MPNHYTYLTYGLNITKKIDKLVPLFREVFKDNFPRALQQLPSDLQSTHKLKLFKTQYNMDLSIQIRPISKTQAMIRMVAPKTNKLLGPMGLVDFRTGAGLIDDSLRFLQCLSRELTQSISSINLSGNRFYPDATESFSVPFSLYNLIENAPKSLQTFDLSDIGDFAYETELSPIANLITMCSSKASTLILKNNHFNPELLPGFFDGASKHLMRVDLEGALATEKASEKPEAIFEFLPSGVIDLNLSGNHIPAYIQKALAPFSSRLQRLNLAETGLNYRDDCDWDLNAWVGFFQRLPKTLHTLDLRGNRLEDDCLREVLPIISESNISSMLVNKSFLSAEVLESFGAILRDNQLKSCSHSFFQPKSLVSESRICDAMENQRTQYEN